jgi:hypothetical protein
MSMGEPRGAKRPMGWGAWILVVLVVGVITTAVTLFAYRYYYSVCCGAPVPTHKV